MRVCVRVCTCVCARVHACACVCVRAYVPACACVGLCRGAVAIGTSLVLLHITLCWLSNCSAVSTFENRLRRLSYDLALNVAMNDLRWFTTVPCSSEVHGGKVAWLVITCHVTVVDVTRRLLGNRCGRISLKGWSHHKDRGTYVPASKYI